MKQLADYLTRQYQVCGKVQGVGFRAATRDFCTQHGIKGHAINQPDGSVEVLAYADAHAIEALAKWLNSGPPAAEVSSVTAKSLELNEAPQGFYIA